MNDNGTQRFADEVFAVVAAIPCGRVLSYGMVARLAGRPGYARMVGRLLAGSPTDLPLPCHRVVGSDGHTVPHWPEQTRMLREEGVAFRSNGCVDMRKSRWEL